MNFNLTKIVNPFTYGRKIGAIRRYPDTLSPFKVSKEGREGTRTSHIRIYMVGNLLFESQVSQGNINFKSSVQ